MNDYIFPFHVQANGVAHKQGMSTVVRGRLELHVMTGGPVFLFSGRKLAPEAAAVLGDATQLHPEFELAASVTDHGETFISASGLDFLTIYSTAESVGYLRVVEELEADPVSELARAMEKLRREGIRLNHDIPHGAIPVDPGGPRLAPMRGHIAS